MRILQTLFLSVPFVINQYPMLKIKLYYSMNIEGNYSYPNG